MKRPVVAWFEVMGNDGPRLQQFYGDLFDWKIQDVGDGYGTVDASEKGIGGGIGRSQDGGKGHVMFYVEVDDPAAYLNKVEKLGGRTIAPPVTLEQFGLTFAFFADPEGHIIGLSKGAVR